MIETELDPPNTECGENESKEIIREYVAITEDLRRDLAECKGEQKRCRSELETLSRETKEASVMARESFSRANDEKLMVNENGRESLDNVEKRISILEMEKDTIYHMWQLSLQTVRALEEELRSSWKDDRGIGYCDERMEEMKQMYSEVIKSLESKLLKAKEYFAKNRAVWEENRERIGELEKKLSLTEREACERRESDNLLIESLKCEANSARIELDRAREDNLELHEKLQEARSCANTAIAKSEESKIKVAEALEIAESAIKEKKAAVERESCALLEKAKLEMDLNEIVDKFTETLDSELAAAQESFERESQKTALEIKELKVELREKITLLDRSKRENKLLEDELEKCRHGTGSLWQRSSANVIDLEEKLKEARFKIQSLEENWRIKYVEKMEEMEARLEASNDRLRRMQLYGRKEFDERVREADARSRDTISIYNMQKEQLAESLNEKKKLACQMRNLRYAHEREIAKKDMERRSQETRTRELQDRLQTVNDELEKSNARAAELMNQIESLKLDLLDKSLKANSSGIESKINQELVSRLKTLQDKFNQKTMELTQHVETHQKLCRRWKDEANSLTAKFNMQTKEFRDELRIMRKENEALNKELLVCREQLSGSRLHPYSSFDEEDNELQW